MKKNKNNSICLVTVVIPTYKRSKLLESAIISVLNQSYENLEILVVDDNSDGCEQDKVQKIIAKFNNVEYLKNFRKKGGCGARNSGILKASGDFIAFLDDDDIFLKGKIHNQLKHLIDTGGNASFTDYVLNDRIYNKKKNVVKNFNKLDSHQILNFEVPASTTLMMAKRQSLIDVGLFDENLPSFQDLDLWYRLSKNGPIFKYNGLLSEFTIHLEDRVSINIDKRATGLNKLIDKWKNEIELIVGVKKFYDFYYRESIYNVIKYSNLSYKEKFKYYLTLNLKGETKLKYLAVLPYNLINFVKTQ
ncbi:glycosyl transferase [Belliella baltica DSM 15883]|uniref:Glycosyl transferase n=1 Tax=Belliella baltica (strain DSM 15883 / CIP 108006 / LMG 21964 / BA134) TaxID=866536 RepID=I3Z6T1_BELBD|nr:glycosyltransferase family A protein [Belliella baltica]AFL84949.1 glycosyl transferase [Belliella baltica DSM 15883]